MLGLEVVGVPDGARDGDLLGFDVVGVLLGARDGDLLGFEVVGVFEGDLLGAAVAVASRARNATTAAKTATT